MRVRIEMDQMHHWWPVHERDMIKGEELEARIAELSQVSTQTWMRNKNTAMFDLPDAFVSRYEKLRKEMMEMQDVLEQLYRHQEGMGQWPTPKVDIESLLAKD